MNNSQLIDAPSATFRALFLDIDGTLVSKHDHVAPSVRRAVQSAREAGCEVVLCTGRTRHRTYTIAEQLGSPAGYAITSNGGVLANLDTHEILYRHLLPVEVALEVIRTVREAGADPFVYEDSDSLHTEGARVLYHPDTIVSHYILNDPRYRPYAGLLNTLPFCPVSISAYGHPNKIRPIAERLRVKLADSVSVIESGTEFDWGVEFYVPGVSKQLGAATLMARLGLKQEEAMAVGDHHNDLELLAWAGCGVAMGNAQPEVLAIADWITASVHDHGVAKAIERFILRQQELGV